MEAILNRLASTVSSANDLAGLTRPILELLEAVTGLESTYLTTIDEAGGVQNILYARNQGTMQIPEGLAVPWHDTLCKRSLDEGRAYTADVAACWGDSDAARALGIKTYLSQPVRKLDGGLYGTLCAASASSVPVPDEAVRVLGMFATLIAHQVERERIVLSLKQSNAELASQALTDPLTGLANRRALITDLRRRLAQVARHPHPLQVAFIDLDGFKKINDQHGHEVGDQFLAHIARRLASHVRAGDLVARYGGDEFVVVTDAAGQDDLQRRLHEITKGLFTSGAMRLDYPGASVGLVKAEPGETDPDELLTRADAAMYEVKKARKAQRTG
jgi:diguanylate cyclase